MHDQKQADDTHALLSRIAHSLEVTATIQLLAIKYPNSTDRDAQLEAYRVQRESVENASKSLKMAHSLTPKAVPASTQAVADAEKAQQAFEEENPLIVRLANWLKLGIA